MRVTERKTQDTVVGVHVYVMVVAKTVTGIKRCIVTVAYHIYKPY